MKTLLFLAIPLLASLPAQAGPSSLSSRLAAAFGSVDRPMTLKGQNGDCWLRVNKIVADDVNDVPLVDLELVDGLGRSLANFRGFDDREGKWNDEITDHSVRAAREFESMLTGRASYVSISIDHLPMAGIKGAYIIIREDAKNAFCQL